MTSIGWLRRCNLRSGLDGLSNVLGLGPLLAFGTVDRQMGVSFMHVDFDLHFRGRINIDDLNAS